MQSIKPITLLSTLLTKRNFRSYSVCTNNSHTLILPRSCLSKYKSKRRCTELGQQDIRSFSNLPRINDPELRKLVFTTEKESRYQLRRAVRHENEKGNVHISLPFATAGRIQEPTALHREQKNKAKHGTVEVPDFMIDYLTAPYNNRRLELLGDSLLELIITEELLTRFDMLSIGEITFVRNQILKNDTFKRISLYIYKLRNYLVKSGNAGINIDDALTTKETTLNDEVYFDGIATASDADLFEAYVGGLFLDFSKATTWENAIKYIKRWLLEIAEPIVSQHNLEQKNEERKLQIANSLSKKDTDIFINEFQNVGSKINSSFKKLYKKFDEKNIYFPKIESDFLETKILMAPKDVYSLLPERVRKLKLELKEDTEKRAISSFCLYFNNDHLVFLGRSLVKFLLCHYFYQKYPTLSVKNMTKSISLSTQALPEFEKKHMLGLSKINEEFNQRLLAVAFLEAKPWKESTEDDKMGLFFRAYLGGLYLSEKNRNEDKRAFGIVKRFFFQASLEYGNLLFVEQPEIRNTFQWNIVKTIYKRHMTKFQGPDPLLRASSVSHNAVVDSKWETQQFNEYQEKQNEQLHIIRDKQDGLVEIPLINQNIGAKVYPLSCQQLDVVCQVLLPNGIMPTYFTSVKMFDGRDGAYDYIVTCQIGDTVISRAVSKDLSNAQQLAAEAALIDQHLLDKSITKIWKDAPFNKTKSFLKKVVLRFLSLYHKVRIEENKGVDTIDGKPAKPSAMPFVNKNIKSFEMLDSKDTLDAVVEDELNGMYFPTYKLISSSFHGEKSNIPSPPFTVACTLRDVTIGIGIGIELEYAKNLAASAALEKPELLDWVVDNSTLFSNAAKYIEACDYVMNTFGKAVDEELFNKSNDEKLEEAFIMEYEQTNKKWIEFMELETEDELEYEEEWDIESEPVLFEDISNSKFINPLITVSNKKNRK